MGLAEDSDMADLASLASAKEHDFANRITTDEFSAVAKSHGKLPTF